MTEHAHNLSGALNLLQNCLNIKPDTKVLLVCESPKFGWYSAEAGDLMSTAIRHLGAHHTLVEVGHPNDPPPNTYNQLLDYSDAVIYLARLGDKNRFNDKLFKKQVAMVYARDGRTLASNYASMDHNAMEAFKLMIDKIKMNARHIKITCPLGTDIDCNIDTSDYADARDVAIRRFPLCVPRPMLADKMNGTVALSRWLTSTGSRSYSPAVCKIDGVVFAETKAGKIIRFHGSRKNVSAIRSHYNFVADQFGIERDTIHSWHAGIHPACSYPHKIDNNPDRWSNNIFGNPRNLHFHTCGAYAPGEICWNVRDPTILIDGTPLWKNGRICFQNFGEINDVVDLWPDLKFSLTHKYGPVGRD